MSNKTPQDLSDEQLEVLEAFARALGQEAHVLRQRPDLLWQQMYNSLSPINIPNLAFVLGREVNRRFPQLWLKRRGGTGATPMRVLASLPSGVECCDWSSVAGLLGIGCRDGNVYILNPRIGEPMTIGAHKGPVSCCRFTPDGNFLISGSKDSTLSVFDVMTRKLYGIFSGHQSPVTSLVVLPNGKHMVSSSQDRTLIIWNCETMQPIKTLHGHDRGILCLGLSTDGSRLVSGDAGGRLILWDLSVYKPCLSFIAHEDAVLCCALNHSGDILATGAADGSVRIWYMNGPYTSSKEFKGHTDEVSGCAFSKNEQLVTVSADQTIRVWNVSTGASLAAAHGYGGALTCLSMQSDGSIAFTGATNGTVLAWTIRDLGSGVIPTGHNAAVTSVSVYPKGYVATSSLDGSAIIWRISDGSILHRLQCDEALVGCAIQIKSDTLITVGSHKPHIEWDIATGTRRRTVPRTTEGVLRCASDPFYGLLVLGTMTGLTVIESDGRSWNIDLHANSIDREDQARLMRALQSQDLSMGMKQAIIKVLQERREWGTIPGIVNVSANCIAVQPGGRLIAAGDVTGRVTLIDRLTRSIVRVMSTPASHPRLAVTAVALAPNLRNLAVGYDNGMVVVYSLESDEIVQWNEQGGVYACSFSDNSQLLAVGTEGKYLAVWKWREKVEVYRLPVRDTVRACAFSADEAVLVCADTAGNVWIVEMIGLKNSTFAVT